MDNASTQNLGGIKDSSSKALVTAKRWWFLCSATSFCCGVYGQKHYDKIPFLVKKIQKSLDMYSPPESERRTLIIAKNWVSTYATNFLKTITTSDLERRK